MDGLNKALLKMLGVYGLFVLAGAGNEFFSYAILIVTLYLIGAI
jgi:hypothetical protein